MSIINQSHQSLKGPHCAPSFHVPRLRLALEDTTVYVDLTQASYLVGRHSEADIRLAMPDVSRRHCRFVYYDGDWKVVDLNSLNGIFLNEQRMHEATLSHGDRLRIGCLTFVVLSHSAQPPLNSKAGFQKLQSIAEALPDPNDTAVQPRKAS